MGGMQEGGRYEEDSGKLITCVLEFLVVSNKKKKEIMRTNCCVTYLMLAETTEEFLFLEKYQTFAFPTKKVVFRTKNKASKVNVKDSRIL